MSIKLANATAQQIARATKKAIQKSPVALQYAIQDSSMLNGKGNLSTNKIAEVILEDGTTREVMHFHPFLAPYKLAILPLVKKYHSEKAFEVYKELSKHFMCTYDESGNIGKRYRRQDVIGTPYVITVDDETVNNNTVTIRDRDTMKQITIQLDEVIAYINDKIKF